MMVITRIGIGIAIACGLAAGGDGPAPEAPDAQFKTLDLKFATPHLPLLKKHAKGEVKAFFLTPADSTLGHVREIVQRGDIAADHAAVSKAPAPAGALAEADLAEFQKRLQAAAPQVLVTLGVRWQAGLKPPLARELLERVRGGMGLVAVVRDLREEPELAAALAQGKEPEAPLPAVAIAAPEVRRFALGKGRVALVLGRWDDAAGDAGEAALGDWATLRLARETARVEELRWRGFEYAYAFLGDLARWAAGQDSPVTLVSAALKGDVVLVGLHNAGEKVMTRVSVTLRSRRWEVRAQGEVQAELVPGESRHLVAIGRAPDGGPLAIEAHVRAADGRTLAFGSVGASAFEAVRMKVSPQPQYQLAGKPVACVVELEGSVPGGRLEVAVLDRFGRLVDRREHVVRLQDRKAHVASLLQGIMPRSVYHEAVARFSSVDAPERLLAEASADVFLLPAEPARGEGFALGVWGAPRRSALMAQAMLDSTRALGLTLHSGSDDDRVLYAAGGLKAAHVSLSIRSRYAAKDEKPRLEAGKLVMHPPLLPSQEAVRAAKDEWQKQARAQYGTGARFIAIDAARRLEGDYDFHPQTLAGFREWLRNRYADIAELNAAWGANFADFAQVVPKRRQELGTSPNLAPWLEFRSFIGELLGEHYVKAPSEWAAEVAPDLTVGEWGIEEPSEAWPLDWSRYARFYKHALHAGEVQGVLEDLFRSFAPDARLGAAVSGQPGGGGAPPAREGIPALSLIPWLALLNRGASAWFGPLAPDGFGADAVLTSDQRPTAAYAALAKSTFPELTGGADRLLLASKPLHDPIAIAYSYPSWLADPQALGREAKTIVEELGFQHLYVTMDDVAAGRLEKDGFKVLIIQRASCLSREQAEGVGRFVEAGGTLLCIGRAGWRDLRGAPHPEGSLLDALTGVDTSKATTHGQVVQTPSGEPLLTLAVADKGVAVADASVLASIALDQKMRVPVWTVRDLGKGKAYWLNADLAQHRPGLEATPAVLEAVRKAHHDIFDHVIAMASIKPRCRLFADGEPVFDGETWYYETPSGRTPLVARYVRRKHDRPLTVRLQKKGIVCEILTRRTVGDSEVFQDTFPPGAVRIYAVLDYRCLGLAAKADDAKLNPGDVLRVRCTIKTSSKDPDKPADLHPLRLRVLGPSGTEVPGYRTVVLAQGGEATAEFRLALNEAPGTHYVHVYDTISGQETRAVFTVSKTEAK